VLDRQRTVRGSHARAASIVSFPLIKAGRDRGVQILGPVLRGLVESDQRPVPLFFKITHLGLHDGLKRVVIHDAVPRGGKRGGRLAETQQFRRPSIEERSA
jgi:hypothetical protein